MRKLSAFWFRLGGLPVRPFTWILAALFSIWVVLDLLVLHVSSGIAHSTFDAMVRTRLLVADPDPRLVIVDIDEASLSRMSADFGRWPWPRDTLATALDHIEKQNPAAIAWDILFADSDRMSPGGDAAFNASVKRSAHSFFSVVRLPASNDGESRITRSVLPGLWTEVSDRHAIAGIPTVPPADDGIAVAMIPPVLDAVTKAPLGYNNAYVDSDGALRRYRYAEPVGSGAQLLQSLPLRILQSLDFGAWELRVAAIGSVWAPLDELIVWRRQPRIYPRVSFADVFAQAEGGKPLRPVPSFAGKIVIIGATAPSLHDVHATPLARVQPGVESLATAIDNALNGRRIGELPRAAQAAMAIAMCLGIAWWAQRNLLASLEPALLLLPSALLAVSYLSLNGSPFFIEMHSAAGLALAFLLVLRYWNIMRRNYWCSPPTSRGRLAVWSWFRSGPWIDTALDRLIDAVQVQAPHCRVLVLDAGARWPQQLRWPELARYAAIIGPEDELNRARPQLELALRKLAQTVGEPVFTHGSSSREELATLALHEWAGRAVTFSFKDQTQ